MATIDESTRQISRLYYDGVNVKQAVKLMRDQGIIANLVKAIYDQLSLNDEKLKISRFHYYNVVIHNSLLYSGANCWTSRYLITYRSTSGSAFHKIEIIDLFNDKSV
jgi:nitric oxide synthase oxygenase domain/subunit